MLFDSTVSLCVHFTYVHIETVKASSEVNLKSIILLASLTDAYSSLAGSYFNFLFEAPAPLRLCAHDPGWEVL